MLYATPTGKVFASDLDELDELRARLGDRVGVHSPWLGQLRRQVKASTAESSISIEGFAIHPQDDAAAIVAGDQKPRPDDEDALALACYASAMDHVGTMAEDPHFEWLHRVVLDLHFDACSFQRDKSPGLYRTTPISVTGPPGRSPSYTGPDAADVKPLMDEVIGWLGDDDDEHVVVRAAMAHLHVVSVHPFRDGNGRISRIVQSLVLAREGRLAPEFGSIEEHLGRNTNAYYAALREVQAGRYQPDRDATPWVRFCVRAHIEQARQLLAQIDTANVRWSFLEGLAERRGWPDRFVVALEQSFFGGVDRASYAAEADVSPATASNDFRRLLDSGLLVQRGKGRTTRYHASESLRADVEGHRR